MAAPRHTPSLYPQLRGSTWADVRDYGSIEIDYHRSGRERVRLRFPDPWQPGKRLRISERPTPNGEWVAFDKMHAVEALAQIRNALLAGASRQAALKPWVRRIEDADKIEARVQRWLHDFELQVEAGDRSPGTLREYRRYAKAGGFFSWWHGRDIHGLKRRDVKDWQQWLAAEHPQLSANSRKKISDAFRAMLREHARDADGAIHVPDFPVIEIAPAPRKLMPLEDRDRVLQAIACCKRSRGSTAAPP